MFQVRVVVELIRGEGGRHFVYRYRLLGELCRSNRKAMNRNWSNQKANPALKTKAGNK